MRVPSRRLFVASLAATAFARPAIAAAPRRLDFQHLHTGERLRVEYHDGRDYEPEALAAVNRLLRDFRSGEVGTIDPALLDVLHALQGRTGSAAPFQVISGFRSSGTNAALRRRSDGVAERSLHLTGRAIDIRVAGVALAQLRGAALSLRAGGVGYYPGSDFVHVDTGRVRAW